MEKLEVLKRSDLFHYLDENDLKVVAGMCKTEEFKPGQVIFRQGRGAEKIYVIEDGLVSLMLEMGPTDKRQIQAASNFECFGWAATIPPYRRLNMARAQEKTKVLSFDGKELRDLVDTNPKLCAEIAGGVAYVISQRLRASFSQLMGDAYQD
ncbi:MAG: cyclic nucleotide-binding domain-containing protein [Dehalococcoidia bacterium]|jgi:CRP-like cAMP-binding protein